MDGTAAPRTIAWVGRFILPHESELRAWLRRSFPAFDVDDIVQETYCRIAALDAVDHIDNPRGYLFRAAHNVVIEQVRRSRVIDIEAASGLYEFQTVGHLNVFSPEQMVSDRQMLSRVEALISALPCRARDIFRMRKIEGLSQREVAAALGLTETIVENDIARGLRRILDAMSDDERAALPLRRSMRIRRGKQRNQE